MVGAMGSHAAGCGFKALFQLERLLKERIVRNLKHDGMVEQFD